MLWNSLNSIQQSARRRLNGHRIALVWFTDLSFDVERSMFDVHLLPGLTAPYEEPQNPDIYLLLGGK